MVTEGRMLKFGDSSVPIGVLPAPGGGILFVAHANGDAVSVIDTASWERVRILEVGREPDALGYSPLSAEPLQGS